MAHHDSRHQVGAVLSSKATTLLRFFLPLLAFGLAAELAGSLGKALVFVAALAVFVAPGFPVARVFFAGAERVLAAGAIGYLASSLLASLFYRVGAFAWTTLGAGSLLLTLFLRFSLRSQTRGDGQRTEPLGVLLSMTLALSLVSLPFLRVGEATPEGRAYRAYFSADLMTHLSVTAELEKTEFPPVDPFYAGAPLGYYWLFFLFPALVGKWTGNQEALLLTYLAGDLLFAGLAFCAARRMAGSFGAAFAATGAGLAAASYEGAAALAKAIATGEPLPSFREANVDAFSRWVLELTSLDGLHRSLLYTPQHLFSYSLLLVLLLLVVLPPGGSRPGAGASLLGGALLGGMAGTSIVTAMLAGPWMVLVILRRSESLPGALKTLLLMGVSSVGCLAWFFHLGFFSAAGAALVLRRPSPAEVPALALLEVGPLLLLAVPALREPRARPLAVLAALALLAVLTLDIEGYEGVWMAWRAGSVLLLSLTLLAAAGLPWWTRWGRPALALILFPAVLTTLLDLYNAQDIDNRQQSAGGFRWTTVVSYPDLEALEWLRTHTPPASVVQMDARARAGGEWAILPAIAERRMAYGYPIFLLEPHKYQARGRKLRPIFNSDDTERARRLAVEAGISYLLIGRAERNEPQNRVRKFWEAPELFEEVYANAESTVFRVR